MKMPHLLRVEAGPESYASFVAAADAAGMRGGWLELGEDPPLPGPLAGAPAELLRAVAAGPRRTVTLKERRREPVLRDLVREHFLGCRFLLVRGSIDAPLLIPEGVGWRLKVPGFPDRELTSESLVAALRSPHFPGRKTGE